jgi:hypothetical protein
VITFLDWKATWWTKQATARQGLQHDLADGVAAYAAKQAHVYRSLASNFATRWHPLLISNGFSVDWPSFYVPTQQESEQLVADNMEVDTRL